MSDHRLELKKKLRQVKDLAITQGLKDGTSEEFKNTLDEADRYSKLLESTEPSWTRDAGAALAVGLFILLITGLLWSRKVRHTDIALVAETSNLHLTLTRDWRLENPLKGQGLRINHLSGLHNPSLGLSIDDPHNNAWLRVEGFQVVVQTLQMSSSASVELTSSSDNLTMSISQAPFQGIVLIVGKGILTAGTAEGKTFDQSYNLEVPETLQFVVEQPQAASSELELRAPKEWSLGIVPCKFISFSYELRSLDERQVMSGLRSGKLTFNDAAWPTKQLGENQLLSLALSSSARTQVRGSHDGMHVTVNGIASDVILGDVGERQRLAPSYLEYLHNRKSLLLFWTAVVAGWGLLWGIRKTIFR